jgi:hypothetical protein
MAQATGTTSSYDMVGNREDLIDKIFDISPTDCPFQTAIGKSKATSKKHEWQTDSLAAADADNAEIEGNEYSYSQASPTTRLANYTQIFRKTIKVTGTQEAVSKAGRKSEIGYQAQKRAKEIKRDLEAALTSNNASVAGDDSTARKLGGLRAWLTTNTALGAGGSPANGGYNSGTGVVDAATDGTQEAFTKARLDTVIKSCAENGADLKMLMLGSHVKTVFSGFMSDSSVAQLRTNVSGNGQATIVGGVETYVSDFGDLMVKYNRFQRARDAFLVDPDYASVAVLRKMSVERPAKTGDAVNYVMLHECTLRVDNEAAHGVVADNSTS